MATATAPPRAYASQISMILSSVEPAKALGKENGQCPKASEGYCQQPFEKCAARLPVATLKLLKVPLAQSSCALHIPARGRLVCAGCSFFHCFLPDIGPLRNCALCHRSPENMPVSESGLQPQSCTRLCAWQGRIASRQTTDRQWTSKGPPAHHEWRVGGLLFSGKGLWKSFCQTVVSRGIFQRILQAWQLPGRCTVVCRRGPRVWRPQPRRAPWAPSRCHRPLG